MVPDFYYRQGKRIHFEFRNEKNQTISINRLDGQALREIQARPKLSNKMVIDDTGAILEFLRGAEHVRRGGVAAIGYCMGGRYVMCVAGTYPEHFVASASLHGTTLISDRDDSPHLLAAKLRPANIDAAAGAMEEIARIVTQQTLSHLTSSGVAGAENEDKWLFHGK